MEISSKKVTINGGREVFVLTPKLLNNNFTSGHNNNKGFVVICGNGSAYKWLSECFSLAAQLEKNEIIYLPIQFIGKNDFYQNFSEFEFNIGIICTNYCETQISSKDILSALQI